MNRPPDWTDLARSIAEQTERLDALIITGSNWIIRDIIVPAMKQGFPPSTMYNFVGRRFLLLNNTKVDLNAVATTADIDRLRGTQYDLIFFDPTWSGPVEWREDILAFNRRRYARR